MVRDYSTLVSSAFPLVMQQKTDVAGDHAPVWLSALAANARAIINCVDVRIDLSSVCTAVK